LVDHHLAVVVEGDGQKNEESLKIDERHNTRFPVDFCGGKGCWAEWAESVQHSLSQSTQ